MQQNIDYSPLDSIKKQTVHPGTIVAGLGLFVCFWIVMSLVSSEGQMIWAIVLMGIGIIAVVLYSVFHAHKVARSNEELMYNFALTNNMAYEPQFSGDNQTGTLFEQGQSKKTTRVLSGLMANLPFHCFEYYYETGSGKSRRSYDAMVMEITLPRVLPQFVIDSQLEDVMPVSFDKSQMVELEGDFHKYFDLYAPDTYGISALTILAPDAMEVLMQQAALCDIEVVQNKLFFYWPIPAKTKLQYEEIFTTAQAVLDKLGKKLTTDNIFATESQARIHASPGASGVRLKHSKIGIFTVLVVVMYFVTEFTPSESFFSWGGLFIVLFWVGFIVWSLFSSFKQSSLKREYLKRYRLKRQ